MTTNNLDDLKRELYEAFDLAIRYAKRDYQDNNNPSHQAAATSLQAAGEAAQAITVIEREQREARELKGVILKDKPQN